ncbi:MAG: methyltransferase, partial [Leptospiraceae bacterium]|nr:methyltransferase [Leptospiraceae bacterium]
EDKQELSCTPGGRAVLGSPHYQDELAGEVFDVPYDSFFQPNPDAFGLLLDKILEAAEPFIHEVGSEGQGEQSQGKKEGSLVDLYCGAGILSRIVARRWPYLRHIKGYEFVQSAVDQATKLFSEAGLEASFEAVDLNQPGSLELNSDLLIADPPRAGLSPGLCQEIARTKPAKYMIYISCNPETQLRDLEILSQSYIPRTAILADCFPYTAHMEQAILLTAQTSQDRN